MHLNRPHNKVQVNKQDICIHDTLPTNLDLNSSGLSLSFKLKLIEIVMVYAGSPVIEQMPDCMVMVPIRCIDH